MDTNKKSNVIVSSIATALLVVILVGATYAYFKAQGNGSASTDVEIITYTTDTLTFYVGGKLEFSLDQDSFAKDTGDKSGTTYAKATLTPNNKTNTATDYYYVYLNISDNTFSYSLGSDKTEILLQVTDADGATVTSLDGLTYSTVTNGAGESVSGFDITTKTGLITLANNKEITANTTTKEDTWNIRVVFVNYNENQADNAGNNFKAKLMIQEEKIQTLADWVVAQYTGTQGANNLYYHDSSLANGANDNSYRYAGASDTTNNFVCFGSDADTCPDDNLYRIIGVFGDQVKLIKWDYATTSLIGTAFGTVSGTVSSVGYTTTNYKGSNSTSSIGVYYYSTGTNTWSTSTLNTTNLNTNFINNIGTEWSNKIAETTWKVGGNTYTNIAMSNAKTAYTNEITNPDTTIESTYTDKIALMYTSDYYYAASPTYWTYPGWSNSGASYDYRAATGTNWMYMGLMEWTVVRQSGTTMYAFHINHLGYVNNHDVGISADVFAVRPVFHLESFVTYGSGSGAKSNPVRLN